MHASAETMGPDPRRPRALRLDHGFLRWGAFLIGLGAVPLAVQAGWLSEVGIDAAWPYWPLALVGIGVGLLVQSTPLAALGAILIGLSFGLPIGAAVGGSDGLPVACIGGPHGPAVGTTRSGTLVAGSSVEVTGGCGDLTVAAEPGTAWSVEGPSDVAIDDLPGRLQIRARPSLGGGDRSVAVTLPAGSLLDVRLTGVAGNLSASMPGADLTGFGAEMNFGRADVNLSGARLRGDLSVDQNFGSLRISLPAEGAGSGRIETNFGSTRVCIPAGAAVRITPSGAFSSNDLQNSGLERAGDAWQTDDYASAATRLDLAIQSNFGSLHLQRGGC